MNRRNFLGAGIVAAAAGAIGIVPKVAAAPQTNENYWWSLICTMQDETKRDIFNRAVGVHHSLLVYMPATLKNDQPDLREILRVASLLAGHYPFSSCVHAVEAFCKKIPRAYYCLDEYGRELPPYNELLAAGLAFDLSIKEGTIWVLRNQFRPDGDTTFFKKINCEG